MASGWGFEQHGDDLVDAALAGVGGLIVEDGHELVAALQRGEIVPGGAGLGVAAEGGGDEGRELGFGLHGGEEAFGHLLGALHAGGVGLYAR